MVKFNDKELSNIRYKIVDMVIDGESDLVIANFIINECTSKYGAFKHLHKEFAAFEVAYELINLIRKGLNEDGYSV